MKTNKKFNISKIKSTVVAAQLMALPMLAAFTPFIDPGCPGLPQGFPFK